MLLKKKFWILLLFAALAFGNSACGKSSSKPEEDKNPKPIPPIVVPVPEKISFEIVRAFPHDSTCYTQGLFFHDGFLYESGGQYMSSSLRKIDPKTGKVLRKKTLPPLYFAEGIARLENKIYLLTWREKKCFVYNLNDFSLENTYEYPGEGWGLTVKDGKLIMSDGSNYLRIIDPDGFKPIKSIGVFDKGMPVGELNELEYDGRNIWANIYSSDDIALINPDDGALVGLLDCNELRRKLPFYEKAEVLNGIAYIPETDTYILTGKYWPSYYEIKLKNK